ncbi:MAG: oligosaccharide flippase family protein [Planctomycetales bacterium]
MSASRKSLWVNLSASWSVYAVRVLIGFFLMPYVIHVLGDAQYGFWIFINSIAGYAGLMYLGFGKTISRYVAKYQSSQNWTELNRVVSLVFSVYSLMATVALGVTGTLMLLAPRLNNWDGHPIWEIRTVIGLLGVNVAIGLVGSVFGGVLIGARRFDCERMVFLLTDVGRLVLILTLLRRDYGLVTIAGIYIAMSVVENLAYLALAFRIVPQLSLHWKHLNRETFKTCFSFSSFAFLNAIATQLIYATDTVVIGTLLGAAAIVPYFIAQRLCQIVKQPIEQISEICMPTAGALQAEADHKSLQQLLMRSMGIAFLLTTGLFVGFAFFAQRLLDLWMGPGYTESYHLLLLLFSCQIIALPVGVVRAFLFGTGNVRFPSLIYVAEAVANLVLSLMLCYPLKTFGVALGTAIPIIAFELFILLPYGLRILKISLRDVWAEAIRPQLIPLTVLTLAAALMAYETAGIHKVTWTLLIGIALGGGASLAVGLFLQHWLAGTLPEWLTRRFKSEPESEDESEVAGEQADSDAILSGELM